MAKIIFSLFFTLMLCLSGQLLAQTAADLEGYTWKDQSTAIQLIDAALSEKGSDVVSSPNLISGVDAPYKVAIFQSVKTQLAQEPNVSVAILNGYHNVLNALKLQPEFNDEVESSCFRSYEQIVQLIQQ